MLPAVDPNPPDPIALLVVDVVELELLELLLLEELVVIRSEKRLVEPLAAPRLVAGEVDEVAPDVSDDDEVLAAVFEETIVPAEAEEDEDEDDEELLLVVDELPLLELPMLANTLEELCMALRDDWRLPPTLLRLPRNRGARSAAKRSA